MWLLLFILVLLAGIELFYFRIADRFNIIDKPNERSSHKRITLRGGGVIFLFGAWLYAAFYGFQYPWFLAGLTLIAAISFADDVHSIPNKIRIVVHFAAMLLMFYQLGLFSAGQGCIFFRRGSSARVLSTPIISWMESMGLQAVIHWLY